MTTSHEDARIKTTAQIIAVSLRQLPTPAMAAEALAQAVEVFFAMSDFSPADSTSTVGYLAWSAFKGQRASMIRRSVALKNKKLERTAPRPASVCLRSSEECSSLPECIEKGICLFAANVEPAASLPPCTCGKLKRCPFEAPAAGVVCPHLRTPDATED